MKHYPLFFTYRDQVFGPTFQANVTSRGRILGADEHGEVWVYGVEPGGLSATGATPDAALNAFRETFRTVLADIAGNSPNFATFQAEVSAFFREVSEPMVADWNAAVAAVRAGAVEIAGAPRESAESPSQIDITCVYQEQARLAQAPQSFAHATTGSADSKFTSALAA